MKYDVIVYNSSVLNLNKHPKKASALNSFAEGAARSGATVRVATTYDYEPSRLAVILGWVTQDKNTPNILLRQQVVNGQKANGGKTMCIDAGCWKYADKENRFLRYSLNGPFYDTAEYANQNSNSEKWQKIKRELNLELKDWRTKGRHILVCMQRDGGFSMKNLDPMDWVKMKISKIRTYTDRPIVIRPHPGKPQDFSKFISPTISVQDSQRIPLKESMHKAHAAVFFNSSSAVAAVCEGVPIFVDDQSCVAWDVANKDLKNIENPEFFERDQWIHNLAAALWSDTEGSQGLIYRKFIPYL
jgi:hypothetical protein